MIIPCFNELFFEKMSNSFKLAPVARIVSSYKDARRIHSWHEETINNRFNRFSLAFYTVANTQTHFNFSLYIDVVNKKIYAFFDEIEAPNMILKDKEIPQCIGQFNISDFYNEMYEFLSNDFSKAVENYYAGSKFGFDKFTNPDDGIYSLCRFCDVSGFAHFSRQTQFRKLNLAFYPDLMAERDKFRVTPDSPVIPQAFSEYGALICNTVSLYISYDISGRYVYVTDGKYLWSVRSVDFDNFVGELRESYKENDSSAQSQFILLES